MFTSHAARPPRGDSVFVCRSFQHASPFPSRRPRRCRVRVPRRTCPALDATFHPIDHRHRPLRQRRRQLRRRLARRDHARAAEEPAGAAPGRSLGVRARPDRHPALGRRQSQPILPARLQPGSRHRLRDADQRHAGQHAEPRPWTGLHRPQLSDAGTGAAHRVPQGPVLRQQRRLLVGGLGRHQLSASARRFVRTVHARRRQLQARRRRQLVHRRAGDHAARRR